MNQAIDSWLNNTSFHLSHSPFLFGIICGGLLGTSINVTSLISLRRLIIQGVPAGIVSYLGSAFAESLFIALITFGSLRLIDSWVIVEPSLKLLITIFCYDTVLGFLLDNRLKIVSFDQKFDLFKIFLCNAVIIFSNPGSIWTASALLTSVETFEFRENTVFLFGIFFGIFFMGLVIGFTVLAITHLWMVRSSKSFRSLLYRFNKVISSLALTLLFISTIYYHIDVYVGTSFTTWSNPLIASPEKQESKIIDPRFFYQPFLNDVDIERAFQLYKTKKMTKMQRPDQVKGLKKYFNKGKKQKQTQNLIQNEFENQNQSNIPHFQALLEERDKRWFSRSPFFRSIKEKLTTIIPSKQEKVKFFQDPSFVDITPNTDTIISPYLFDKTSKRIAVRQLTTDEFLKLKEIREKRFQDLKKFLP